MGKMNSMRLTLVMTGWLLGLTASAQTPLDQMAGTERAFAQRALTAGNKQAFLSFMADSAVMPIQGRFRLSKPVWQQYPDWEQKLLWGPAFAAMATAGDLGYTYGPAHTEQNGQRINPGYFITVWQRQADGSYQFALDMGVDAPASTEAIPATERRSAIRSQPGRNTEPGALIRRDQAFADALAQGKAAVYPASYSREAARFRSNELPQYGLPDRKSGQSALRFKAEKGQLSTSGDLGYVYGTFESTQDPALRGIYLRIWKNEASNGWRIVVEVLSVDKPRS